MKQFFNLPEKVNKEHYENVRHEIQNLFSKNKSVLSIYEYGSVSSPGVSDMDLIFILNDHDLINAGLFDLHEASESAKKLVADGTVIKMPKNVMQNLMYVDKLFPKRILGKEIFIREPTQQEKNFIACVALIDWLPERILKLGKIYNSEKINVNNALCTLHSFCYSLKTLNKILGADDRSLLVISKTSELRNNWYDLVKPEKGLLKLLKLAIEVGHEQIFSYFQFLKQKEVYIKGDFITGIEVDLELYPECFLRFIDTKNSIDFNNSLRLFDGKRNYIILPSYFLPHFYYQSLHGGCISNNIRSKFSLDLDMDLSSVNKYYLEAIKTKISIMEENAQFLRKNNISSGLLRFGFHF